MAKAAKTVKKVATKKAVTKPVERKRGGAIALINAHAKATWKKDKGEKWKAAIKRASVELKKAKKI